jgi:predicted exporter
VTVLQSRRLGALGAWLLMLVVSGVLIAQARFTADLSAFLPVSPDPQQRLLIEQLQSGVAARTLMIGIEGGDATQRAEASRTLAAALRASGLFEQVQNGDRADWRSSADLLLIHRYQLSSAVGPERFRSNGLHDAIEDTLALLGTTAGAAVKPLLYRDPTGEVQRIVQELIPANAPRSENGVWVSRRAPRALLLLTTHASGADMDGQAGAIAEVRRAFAPQAANGLILRMSGPGVFGVETRERIEHEATLLSIVGAVVIGGLLVGAFASLRALAAAMLPAATGIGAGIAAVSFVFGTVHGITLAFGSTLIGEAVDYAIYYLIQARSGGWRRWLSDSWPTVRLGLLTSVCGFAALLFSGFPGLEQLGVFSIAGLVAAALATRYVLPTVMPEGSAGHGLRRCLARFAGLAVQTLPRARRPLLALGAGTLLLLVPGWNHLWRGDLATLSPVPQPAQALDAVLRADLGASDARTLVVANGADLEAALRAAEAAASRLDSLVREGDIAGYDTPTRLLPSLATQRERQASLPDAKTLRASLEEATRDSPLKASRLQPFIDDVQAARHAEPILRAQLEMTALKPLVDALLFERSAGGWSALVPLQPGAHPIDAARVRAALQGLPHDVLVIDIKHELDSLYSRYLREALAASLAGALAVVAVIGVQLRSWRRALAVCGPLLLAVLFTLGGLAAVGVPLGILHLVGLLLVVAVGSNYGLFFDNWRHTGAANADTLASLVLANLTTAVAFGLIALSDIPALSAIGRVVAPGALLALLLSGAFSYPPARARA